MAAILVAFLLLVAGAIALWSDNPMSLSRPAFRRASETLKPRSAALRQTVMLFFLAQDQKILQEEPREIEGGTTTAMARRTLEELVRGPESELKATIPPSAHVYNVFVDSSGTAYVDFSRQLREGHPGGAEEEVYTVFSIVDSLAFNFPQIRQVQILIEGGEVYTLRGGVITRGPLTPRHAF
jgi:spore germination protein GerM